MNFKQIFVFFLTFISFELSAQSEVEPNESFIQANEIKIDSINTAFIGESGDTDIFKFNIAKGGMIKIEVLEAPSNIDLHWILYNTNNSQAVINRNFTAANGDGFYFWTSTCEIGNHYLFFEDGGVGTNGGDQFNVSIAYKFRIKFISFDEVDECECDNESMNSACEIELGESYSALIAPWYKLSLSNSSPTVDKDYYKFEIPTASQIHIQVTEVPANIEIETFIYDSELDFIWSDFSKNNGELFDIWLSSCFTGTYFLYFRDGSATSLGGGVGFNPEDSYSFRVDTVSLLSEDPHECNNSFNDATIIELCTPISATINPWFRFNDLVYNGVVEDVDYFKLELKEGKETDIIIDYVPSNVGLCLAIYDKWQEPLVTYSGNLGQPLNINFTPPEDGIYYIEIQDCESNFSVDDKYTLKVGCNLISTTEEYDYDPEINIFPNPLTDVLNIQFEDYLGQNAKINIFDILGHSVYQKTMKISNNLNIQTTSFPKGLLILQIEIGGRKHIQNILKI